MKKSLILNWVYCECGCKGLELVEPAIKLNFWLFWHIECVDEKNLEWRYGKHYLWSGHNRNGKLLGVFDSHEDADKHAATLINVKQLREQRKAINNLLNRLNKRENL